jgi:hypothetical protein
VPPQTIDLGADVEALREKCTRDAQFHFAATLAWLAGPAQQLPVQAVERELSVRLKSLGLLLMTLFLALHTPLTVPEKLRSGRGWYVFHKAAFDVVRTRFGEAYGFRAVYQRVGGRGPDQIVPEDRAIGLADGRMTLDVHLRGAWLAARVVFDDVGEIAARFGEYLPSKRALLGVVDQLGPFAEALLACMPVPSDDGEILVIQTDEKGAPMMGSAEHGKRCKRHRKQKRGCQRAARRMNRRHRPRVRRKKGDKSKNARMATVAVIYTLRKTGSGALEGPVNKRVIATFRGRRHLFALARAEAVRRGLNRKKVYFLADGALGLWKLQREFFPTAIACVDWYHVCEYLWAAGRAVHDEGTDPLRKWVEARKDELRHGRIDEMFTAIEALNSHIGRSGPGTKGRRERVATTLRYLRGQRERLRYDELLRADLDIATGAVEGAVNHVVGMRLDRSMMRWSLSRAENVVALRCVQINGLWDTSFTAHVEAAHAAKREPCVSRITPQGRQQPYDAVRKAA